MYKGILLAVATMVAGAAAAQGAQKADPADPKARTPSVEYRSAFTEYRPYSEPELVKWREANDEVKAAAADAGHTAEGANAAKPAAKPGAAPAKPPPGGHAGQ